MASPAFQAVGTAANGIGAVSPAWPTHATDDVALLFVESCGGEPVTLSTPAGFTAISNSPVATGTGTAGTQLSVFWCRATSSSMSAPTVADPGDHVYAVIVTYRNCAKGVTPIDVTATGTNAANSTSITFPSLTTSHDDELIVYAGTKDLDSAAAFMSAEANTNLTGVTERFDAGTTSGNGGGIGIWTGLKATAGSTGTGSATVTNSLSAFMSIALLGEHAPTITLDTADATAFSTSTPSLLFTGTDPEVEDLRYYVHIDNALDRCGDDLADITPLVALATSNYSGAGQSFTATASVALTNAYFLLSQIGSPTGNAVAKLYAHSGTFGTSSVPTGTALATSDNLDVSTITGSAALYTFTFSTPYTLTAGTNYVITIEYGGDGNAGHFVSVYGYSASVHGGNESSFISGAWNANASKDLAFYVWTSGTQTLVQKNSNADAGFADQTNGADTDPFASGDQIQYTVQSALATGSYSWYALALDPAGSNTKSAAPTTRTFSISSGSSPSDGDTGSATEGVTSIKISDGDSGSGVEAIVSIRLSVTDTATGTDAIGSIKLAEADTGTGSESTATALTNADSGTGTEAAALRLAGSDTATGSEAQSLGLAGSDSGAATDSSGALALAGSDSGTSAEAVALALASADTAAAVEAISGLRLSSTDAATFGDVVASLAVTITDGDVFSATDGGEDTGALAPQRDLVLVFGSAKQKWKFGYAAAKWSFGSAAAKWKFGQAAPAWIVGGAKQKWIFGKAS